MSSLTNAPFGIVTIGRNEGDRLKRCLQSLPPNAPVVYVDSGSTDGSDLWARDFGAQLIRLDHSIPFTAARARNAGFRRLIDTLPDLFFVQFIDGDCELCQGWLNTGIAFLCAHDQVAAAFGRLRERHPELSIYNRLCDWEWEGEPGETSSFGGIVILRASALKAANGYREDVIAGEEPELGVRLRRAGWQFWRLNDNMATHDAAMLRFWQWWRRNQRSGYAFANGAHLHGAPPERHWVWESQRARLWGLWLPLLCLAAGIVVTPWGFLSFVVYPAQLLRQTMRETGDFRARITKAFFQLLGRFPEALGQLEFLRDRLFGRPNQLIEYK